ncbi:hypothetical protein RND71_020403 [Anisodus tanguticus]|uniref:Uncharacterized protein n=1 Tax=Anisodus tanguticus TaxID=243964 RepID=A0AAE1VFB6_9SOLA|nr:hypothetical protein RND71_020403 [Anisodus tanguticus]
MLSNKRKLKSIMDARMEGQYSSKAAMLAAQITLKCVQGDPKNRPSMKEVMDVLEQIEAINEKPKESKSKSENSSSQRHRQSPRSRQSPRQTGSGKKYEVKKLALDMCV